MDRLEFFLPSVLAIASIAGFSFLILFLIRRRFKEEFKSLKWLEEQRWKTCFWFSCLYVYVFAPAIEELLFRGPLIIWVQPESPLVWHYTTLSAIIFSLVHWRGHKISIRELFDIKHRRDRTSDDLEAEVKRLKEKESRLVLTRKITQTIITFPLGLLAGYYGVKYQSIWVSIGIHSMWNLFMPIAFPMTILLIALATVPFQWAWTRTVGQRS